MFDIVELKECLPKQHRTKITDKFVTDLNNLIKDPDYGELYAKNVTTYSTVLQEGKFRLTDYFNAVAFVSYKMLGLGNLAAYQKVFPDKCQKMVARNLPVKDMHAFSSTYNKTKLVTLIYEQTLIPDHIMYASVRHRAIAAQAALLNSSNEHIVQKAADSLMNHLASPESAKLTIDIGAKDTGVISDLSNALASLANQQQQMITSGVMNARQIAHSKIIEGEKDD